MANAKLRRRVRKRDGDLCWICGQVIDFTIPPGTWMGPSLEHVLPLAAGGTWALTNLRLSHAKPCNFERGREFAREYRVQYGINARLAVRLATSSVFESWSACRL